jgi:hypothetical protein
LYKTESEKNQRKGSPKQHGYQTAHLLNLVVMATQANAPSFLSPSPFPCLWAELPWAAGKKTQQDHEAPYLERSKSWILALKPRENQNVAVSLTKMCVALWMRCTSGAIILCIAATCFDWKMQK